MPNAVNAVAEGQQFFCRNNLTYSTQIRIGLCFGCERWWPRPNVSSEPSREAAVLLLYPGQLAAVITLVGQCQALFRIQRAYCSIGQGEPFRTRPKHVLSGVAGAALFTAVRYTGEAVHLGQQTSVSAQRCPAPTIRGFHSHLMHTNWDHAFLRISCRLCHFLVWAHLFSIAYTWIWGHDPAIAWCVWEAFAGLKTPVQGRM